MAALGSARRGARAYVTDNVGGHRRMAQAFIGEVYAYDNFVAANGTDLHGKALNVGGTWAFVSLISTIFECQSDRATYNATGTTVNHVYFNSNRSDYCLSVVHLIGGVVETASLPVAHFRLPSNTAEPNDASPFLTLGFSLVTTYTSGATTLFRNGVSVATGSISSVVPAAAANGYMAWEVIVSGSTIRAWCNGSLIINYTTADLAENTYVGIGVRGNAVAVANSVKIEEIFLTSVLSCPGAVDLDQESTRWNLAPIAAGAQFTGDTGLHCRLGVIGLPVSSAPVTARDVRLRTTAGANIRTDGNPGFANTTFRYDTFTGWYATSDGTSTGSPRTGMFELYVQHSGGSGLTQHVVASDGSAPTLPTQTTHDHGRGYAVATTTMATVAKPSTLMAYTNVVNVTATIAHTPWFSGGWLKGDIIQNGSVIDTEIPVAGPAFAFADTIDSTYFAGLDGVGLRFTGAPADAVNFNSEPVLVFTAAPAGFRVTGTNSEIVETSSSGSAFTEDAFNADPRITFTMVSNPNAGLIFNRGEATALMQVSVLNANAATFTPLNGTHQLSVIDASTVKQERNTSDGSPFNGDVVIDTTGYSGDGIIDVTVTFDATSSASTDGLGQNKNLRWRDTTAAGAETITSPTPADVGPFAKTDSTYEVRRHLQVNANASIQTAETEVRFTRLTSDLGFFTFQIRNRRGQNKSGVSLAASNRIALRDDTNLVNQLQGAAAATTDAQGYFPLVTWDSALPGGGWDIWMENGAGGNGAIATHNGNTASFNRKTTGSSDFTLLAVSPYLRILVNAGPGPAVSPDGNHWIPGEDLLLGMAMFDSSINNLIDPDVGTAYAQLGRFDDDTGLAEYFEPTLTPIGGGLFIVTGGTWVTLTEVNSVTRIPLIPGNIAVAGGDDRVFVTTIPGAVTASWSTKGLFVIGGCTVSSTPYMLWNTVEVVGPAAAHAHHYEVVAGGGSTNAGTHWVPGEAFRAGMGMIDNQTGQAVNIVADGGTPEVALIRFRSDLTSPNAGLVEYLKTDVTEASGYRWEPLHNYVVEAIEWYACTRPRPDSDVYTFDFPDTSTWSAEAPFVLARASIGLRVYGGATSTTGVLDSNRHDKNAFDPTGLFK